MGFCCKFTVDGEHCGHSYLGLGFFNICSARWVHHFCGVGAGAVPFLEQQQSSASGKALVDGPRSGVLELRPGGAFMSSLPTVICVSSYVTSTQRKPSSGGKRVPKLQQILDRFAINTRELLYSFVM